MSWTTSTWTPSRTSASVPRRSAASASRTTAPSPRTRTAAPGSARSTTTGCWPRWRSRAGTWPCASRTSSPRSSPGRAGPRGWTRWPAGRASSWRWSSRGFRPDRHRPGPLPRRLSRDGGAGPLIPGAGGAVRFPPRRRGTPAPPWQRAGQECPAYGTEPDRRPRNGRPEGRGEVRQRFHPARPGFGHRTRTQGRHPMRARFGLSAAALAAASWALLARGAAYADVGDPTVETDHPHYAGEGAFQTVEQCVARATAGKAAPQDRAIALYLWILAHQWHLYSPQEWNVPGVVPDTRNESNDKMVV